jgi:hypothetical protein
MFSELTVYLVVQFRSSSRSRGAFGASLGVEGPLVLQFQNSNPVAVIPERADKSALADLGISECRSRVNPRSVARARNPGPARGSGSGHYFKCD